MLIALDGPSVVVVRGADLNHCERVFFLGLVSDPDWCTGKPHFNRCSSAHFAQQSERASSLSC
jgi:hypothetical protein